jgi:hypothetical protein
MIQINVFILRCANLKKSSFCLAHIPIWTKTNQDTVERSLGQPMSRKSTQGLSWLYFFERLDFGPKRFARLDFAEVSWLAQVDAG